MYKAWQRFGKLPWADLIVPSIEICREGIPVGEHLYKVFDSRRDILLAQEEMR